MNVFVLPTVRSQDALSNLESFVARAKASNALGPVPWDAAEWPDVPLKVKKRLSTGRGAQALIFSAEAGSARARTEVVPIPGRWNDLIKAIVRLREAERPSAIENYRTMIAAVRYLAQVTAGIEWDPCRALPHHFDEAANLCRSKMSANTAYGYGKVFADIAKALDDFNIGRVRLGWSNTVPRPKTDDRISPEAAQRREDKLPSRAALDALPLIANMIPPGEEADLLRMRTVELLVSGGFRINELMSVLADCEVEEIHDDGTMRYGIKYNAEKGFGHTIKWMPSVMVDVAKRAIADIKRITQPVRDDAKWMLEHPGLANVPGLVGNPDRVMPGRQIAVLLGWVPAFPASSVKNWNLKRQAGGFRVGDVLQGIYADVPWPKSGRPLHEYMFLIRENMMHRQRGVTRGSVRVLTSGMLSDFLVLRPGMKNVFARYGFTEPDGSPISVRTHQFRHWLNTIAQEGGMRQELIARWSGRKDIGQNAAYDHVSGKHLAEQVRAMAEQGNLVGPIARVRDKLPPVDRAAFMATSVATAHVTEIGLCIHDWSLAPCPLHGDCTNCTEHVVDKGNAVQAAEAERQIEEVQQMLALASHEAEEGTYGAPRWRDAHDRRLQGLQAVKAIHEDPSIPHGTLVHTGAPKR